MVAPMRWRPALTTLALALLASPARADEAPARPTTRLAYERAASACPDEAELRREVAQRLGYDPFAVVATSRVRVSLAEDPPRGFRGVVSHEDGAGQVLGARELQSSDCRELVASIALTVVILLDPKGRPTTPPAAPPPVAPAPVALPPPRAVAPPAQPRPSAPPVELRAGAGVLGALFVAPATSVGFFASAGLARGGFSVDAELRGDLPASADGVRTSLLVGVLSPCLHRGVLLACACASLGALSGEALTSQDPRRASTLYAALGPRVGVELPLGPALSIAARVDASFPLTPTTLRQGGVELWTSPALGVSAGGGLVGRFR